MSWKRFKNPEFFGQLGKPLLVRLVGHFSQQFTDEGIAIPDTALEEKEYLKQLAALGASERGFPNKMADVLCGIVALGNEDGKNRLIHAAAHMNRLGEFSQTGTCEDFALQFFLIAPEAFEKKVHEAQILAKSSFQVFGANFPSPEGTQFPKPTKDQMRLLKSDVDEWVAQEYRGEERATDIEHYEMGDEHLFLIRIGDSNARHAVVEGNGFTYQHFRPAKDLILTFSAARDEIRINGKGSKKIRMIREAFGRRFFGDPDRFSVRDPFTLAPLVRLGPAALEVTPGQGIQQIVLTELIQETDGDAAMTLHFKGPNLFEFAEREHTRLFWNGCKVTGAGFDILFAGQTTPRQFFLREGNGLRQVRNCDVVALYRWMLEKKFRKTNHQAGGNNGSVAQN